MRLALLGASGRIGQHVPACALESGHQVAAPRQTSLRGAASPGAVGKHLVADVLDAA